MTTLFIYTEFSSFVKNDYYILKKYSNVKMFCYKQGKSLLRHFLSQFNLFKWLIIHIWFTDKIYCWFADYHSFFPALISKFFNKKLYVVLGGYDVTHIPEIGYGSLKNPLRKWCTLFTIRYATVNLAVSDYISKKALKLVHEANVVTVYNGVDTQYFQESVNVKNKNNLILTVGAGDSEQRIKLKGIDFFNQIARALPQYKFLVIGVGQNIIKCFGSLPRNLEILGFLPYSDLIQYYEKAKIYCQFSLVESFGMSLAEAMLCKCVPIVFNAGAMPEIVNNAGLIVERNPEIVIQGIKEVINKSADLGKKAKHRVQTCFTLQIREQKLKEILKL